MSSDGNTTPAAARPEPGAFAPLPAWLAPQAHSLAAALAADRMPHALLIHEAPGAGGDWLAIWTAQLVLCQRPGPPSRGPTCVWWARTPGSRSVPTGRPRWAWRTWP